MATLSQAKTLGGVGSILVFVPFVSIIGYIFVIIAVKEISDDLHDSTIFNNVVIAAVTGIVGALAGGFFFVFGAITAAATFNYIWVPGGDNGAARRPDRPDNLGDLPQEGV